MIGLFFHVPLLVNLITIILKIKFVSFFKLHPVIFPSIVKNQPLSEARLVFTDGSSKGYAVVLSEGKVEKITLDSTSAQLAKLKALPLALSLSPEEPCNIYTDSAYVSNIIYLWKLLHMLLLCLLLLLSFASASIIVATQRSYLCRAHQRAFWMPGPLAGGNADADFYTRPRFVAIALDSYDLALQLHRKFNINSQSLRHRTGCTKEQAVQIVTQCPSCAPLMPSLSLGVNPRGLMSNDIWQMDVTHVPSFGKLKYVHVSIDTYSGLIFASAHSGGRIKDGKSHCLEAFAFMNVPRQIKTDNGPAYTSKTFQQFCAYDTLHKTGIPYNSQGQAIVGEGHLSIKNQLERITEGGYTAPPTKIINCSLYLKFLIVDKAAFSAADRHWRKDRAHNGLVKWKDLASGAWKGPDPIIVRVRGSACIFPKDAEAPVWVPENFVRPVDDSPPGDILKLHEESPDPDASGNT